MGYLGLATGLQNIRLPGDIPYVDWDSWHTLIITDELSRVVRPKPLFDGLADHERGTPVFCGDWEVETALVFHPL